MSPEQVAPSREDPVAREASTALGGPLGDRAGAHPWWTPWRVVLLLTAVAFALGMVKQVPCYATGWSDQTVRYAQMCYSDLPYLYTGRGFAEAAWPYDADPQVRARYEQVMEYPVGISYWAWGTAKVTHLLSGSPDLVQRGRESTGTLFTSAQVQQEQLLFVTVNAVGLALLTLLAAWFLTGVNPRRPWDAAAFALLPALALTELVNWDLLAVVLVAAALWAWARDRPVLTGVLIGLGTAVKLYPLFLLGGLLVICVRRRTPARFVATTAATAVSWALANLPAWLTGPEQWKVFWSFNSERAADLGSVWLAVQQATGHTIDVDVVNRGSWVFFIVWCLGVAALGMAAPRTPRLAQLGLLVVAGFLLVNKVYSPQYVLWLLPLAVLARPRWRDLLVWQAGEVLYFAAVWWYLGGFLDSGGGQVAGFYLLAIIARLFAELYLVSIVVRDVLSPEHDPVEREPSTDQDPVDVRRGEPAAHVDLLADRRDA